MSDETPEVEPVETSLDRFARLYTQTERGKNLWSEWMATQTPESVAVMEKYATDVAEEHSVTVEEAQSYIALQKLIEDRGLKFVERFLRQNDNATKALQPMALARKKARR